jgi:peroxiredoxin family protein
MPGGTLPSEADKEGAMTEPEQTLSLVLFSGTDDKLAAAGILAVGAAAMGRPVNVLIQYWALDAFRADRILKDHGVAPEAGPDAVARMERMAGEGRVQHWSELFWQAKDIGGVGIHACSLSMEMFGIHKEELDELVDDVEGVAAFMAEATGPVVFI